MFSGVNAKEFVRFAGPALFPKEQGLLCRPFRGVLGLGFAAGLSEHPRFLT